MDDHPRPFDGPTVGAAAVLFLAGLIELVLALIGGDSGAARGSRVVMIDGLVVGVLAFVVAHWDTVGGKTLFMLGAWLVVLHGSVGVLFIADVLAGGV